MLCDSQWYIGALFSAGYGAPPKPGPGQYGMPPSANGPQYPNMGPPG